MQCALAHLVSSCFLVFALGLSTDGAITIPPADPLASMPSCVLPVQNVTAVAACYVLPSHDACVRENMHLLASQAFFPLSLVLGL